MISLFLALAALSLLILLALVLAVAALCQGRALQQAAGTRLEMPGPEVFSALQGLRSDLDGLAAQLHDMQQLPPPASIAAPARGGLNLAKRSHALRLHKHGDSAPKIAATLEIPVQEVELLLKVHRIVLSNF
ncbi:conserved exported hypothetical protein [Candidatus Sulfopaludibacter sp. SbA3]|nr:conserved exported hypothetical protein [Candidatus Sulfopaludibacter sp. SbA3]